MTQKEYMEKFNKVYPNGNIEIISWKGYCQPIEFYCDICKEKHLAIDARQLLNKKHYCQKKVLNNVKWDLINYNDRINKMHSEKIKILEYNGLSNPVKYECPICKKIKSCNPARSLITRKSLCDECYGVEKDIIKKKIYNLFQNSKDYKLLVWRGANKKLTEQCLKCNFVYDRRPNNVLQCFNSCPNCNSGGDKQKKDIREVQRQIDKSFETGYYELLVYKGQLNKHNKIRCLSCGLIFETSIVSFVNSSRGCPKCKRYKSKGEQKVQKYLEDNQVIFETQKRFKECNNNLSSFDFCAYDVNKKMFLIEVNGIQYYKQTQRFEDLEVIKKRDDVKINFCKQNNIPLIIIPYYNLNNIDQYLSILKGSTTIPNGSKEQAIGS